MTDIRPLRFRSYFPKDPKLRELVVVPEGDIINTVKESFNELAMLEDDEVCEDQSEPILTHQSLLSLAPQKVNWDLKRDIESRNKKLDRATQKAVAILVGMYPSMKPP